MLILFYYKRLHFYTNVEEMAWIAFGKQNWRRRMPKCRVKQCHKVDTHQMPVEVTTSYKVHTNNAYKHNRLEESQQYYYEF